MGCQKDLHAVGEDNRGQFPLEAKKVLDKGVFWNYPYIPKGPKPKGEIMEEKEKPIVDIYLDDEAWRKRAEEFLRDIYALATRAEEIQAELRRLRATVIAGAIVGALIVAGAIIFAAVFL